MPYKDKLKRYACSRRWWWKHIEANRKERREYMKWYREQYPEKVKESLKKYHGEYYEKYRKSHQKWRLKNIEKIRLHRKLYKLRKRNAGKITIKEIQRIYEENIKKFGTLTCILCNKLIEFGEDSLEHKIPLSRGGTNDYENLAIAHRSCNSKKHTKTMEEFQNAKSTNL